MLSGGMSNTILYIPVYHYDGHLEFPSGCTAERGGSGGEEGGWGGVGGKIHANAAAKAHKRIDFEVAPLIRVTCRATFPSQEKLLLLFSVHFQPPSTARPVM